MANANRDLNRITTLIATSNVDGVTPVDVYADPITHRLLVDSATVSGTVTSVSVVTANGFAGTVATATTTPAITISTTITGILKGNGTTISAATAGTDYSAGTSALATGILKSTTTTGALTIATGGDLPTMTSTVGGAVPTPPNNTTTFLRGDGTFATPAGGGTVTAVSVASSNGFTGTSSGGSTPILTLATSITGVLSGNGTAISAATTTGSGNVVLATSPTLTTAVLGSSTATTQASGDNSTKVATTAFVAAALSGINPAVSVQAATTANVSGYTYNNGVSGVGATLTQNSAAVVVIDGYTLLLNDRVLFKNQTTAANNGVYFISTLGTGVIPAIFTRALDYDMPSDINNTGAIPVINGTVNALTSWVLTTQVTTMGTDPLSYSQFSYSPNTIISPTLGGTGVANNSAMTVTGSGNFAYTRTLTGNTNLTFPTSGTVTAQGNSVTGSGSIVLATSPALTTPNIGVATGTNVLLTANAITATSNAATIPISSGRNVVTNSSAATLTITLTTASAANMQTVIVQVLDFSAVAQTITWVNTENSTVSVPATSNGSTTLPLTVGFIYNNSTSKWRCIASA